MLREKRVALPVLEAVDTPPAPVVEDRLLDLHLDQLALFLDHDDELEPLGPMLEPCHVERPCLADLVGGDAQPLRLGRVDPQRVERPDQIEPVLARRDEADLRAGFPVHAPVDAVGMGEGLRGEALVGQQPFLLRDPVIAEADVQTALGHIEGGGT